MKVANLVRVSKDYHVGTGRSLKQFDRGDLNDTHPGYTGINNRNFNQAWTLDDLGNWQEFKTNSNGDEDYTDASDLEQDRTHNLVNEISGITEQSNPQQAQWVDPAYDAAGNRVSEQYDERCDGCPDRCYAWAYEDECQGISPPDHWW